MALTMGGNTGFAAEMNVTPMIDILLVLIIIFMVIQPAPNATGMDALAPHPPQKPGDSPRTVVVELIEAQTGPPMLLINREPVAWEQLHSRFVEIYKTRAERVLFVKADRTTDFAEVANVIDAARGAFRDIKIGLITT